MDGFDEFWASLGWFEKITFVVTVPILVVLYFYVIGLLSDSTGYGVFFVMVATTVTVLPIFMFAYVGLMIAAKQIQDWLARRRQP